jgi:hypothetical protein
MKRRALRLAFSLGASLGMSLALPGHADPLMVSKPVDMRRAMDDVALAAANHDLVLVKVQPIDTALAKRGFENPHMRLLFIGSESAVRWAEAAEPRR